MPINFNRQNFYFGKLNNSQQPFAKWNSNQTSNPMNKLIDMLNQQKQSAKNNAAQSSTSQSSAKPVSQRNEADSAMLTPQDAERLNAKMNATIPKFEKPAPITITRLAPIHTEAMSVERAVSSIPRKINDDGTITAPNLEELRENGLPAEINYSELDTSFKFKTNYSNVQNDNDVREIVDYFASTYAVLQQRIQNDFAGEEQAAQLEKLDEYMAGQIDRFSTQFADVMGDFSSQIGVDESKDKLYQSVKEAIYDQTRQFQEYIAENPDYAQINDTVDSWLNRHTEYMSSHLRSTFSDSDSVSSTTKTDALYSKNELASLSSFAKTATEIWNKIDVNSTMSEEEIGLKLGMMALEADILADKSNVSDEYKSMAAKHTQKVIGQQIDKVNDGLKAYGSPSLFPTLDTSVIKNIVGTMRNEYAQTKNISSAIQKGAALGYTSFHNRLNAFQADKDTATPHRYSYVGKMWDTMYTNEDSYKNYQNPSVLEKFHTSLSNIFNETIPFTTNNLNEKV